MHLRKGLCRRKCGCVACFAAVIIGATVTVLHPALAPPAEALDWLRHERSDRRKRTRKRRLERQIRKRRKRRLRRARMAKPPTRKTARPMSRRLRAAVDGGARPPSRWRRPARYLGQRVLRQEPPPAGLRQSAQGPADDRQGGGRQLAGRLRRGRHPARNLGPHRARPAPTASRSACRTTARASSRSRSR